LADIIINTLNPHDKLPYHRVRVYEMVSRSNRAKPKTLPHSQRKTSVTADHRFVMSSDITFRWSCFALAALALASENLRNPVLSTSFMTRQRCFVTTCEDNYDWICETCEGVIPTRYVVTFDFEIPASNIADSCPAVI
jgi:hypothetical protein